VRGTLASLGIAIRHSVASTHGTGPSAERASSRLLNPNLVDADAGSGSPRRKAHRMVESVVAFTLALVLLVVVMHYMK
jgi:hypothetical protein